MKTAIGFVGVGAMGAGLAINLARRGFPVWFVARDTARGQTAAARLEGAGAQRVADLAALGRQAGIVILCLPDSPAVEAVLDPAAGLTPNLAAGGVVIDCSTSHPASTRRLAAELAARGLVLLEAPLTGSRAQAEAGTVNVLGAGPKEAFERVRPVLEGFAAHVFHLGGTGAGHTAKLINNYLGQLALAGLCEAWPLIAASGIEPQALFDAISVSGGNSATFQGAYPRLRQRDFAFSFAQRLAGKDIRYFREVAEQAGQAVPLAGGLQAIHDQATAAGYGDQDVKALLLYYEERASKAAR
ncbi:MAG: NAD(P)-dependent oxidoreductase [Opitutaceae bacterium]|nr:NAD(P)-dependent oxidoreductase [Opitutaceae bacterium]